MAEETRGGFITLEGGEGVGKSTQVKRLAARLWACGREVVATREPGGSSRAERIRTAILSGQVAPLGPSAEALMFAAARLDHVDTRIRPAIERGAFVICDRFIDSTRAYQGTVGDADPLLIAALERVAIGSVRPDLTILLDLAPALGLARARERRRADEVPDRFEREDEDFHERLRAAFLRIAARQPERMRVIDAAPAPETVAQAIWDATLERFPGLVLAAASTAKGGSA